MQDIPLRTQKVPDEVPALMLEAELARDRHSGLCRFLTSVATHCALSDIASPEMPYQVARKGAAHSRFRRHLQHSISQFSSRDEIHVLFTVPQAREIEQRQPKLYGKRTAICEKRRLLG